jgi:hypothetical protein
MYCRCTPIKNALKKEPEKYVVEIANIYVELWRVAVTFGVLMQLPLFVFIVRHRLRLKQQFTIWPIIQHSTCIWRSNRPCSSVWMLWHSVVRPARGWLLTHSAAQFKVLNALTCLPFAK